MFYRDRYEIEYIALVRIRLNGRDVRIHEYYRYPFFSESFYRLTPRIIEFTGFTDLQGSRAEDENFFIVMHTILHVKRN